MNLIYTTYTDQFQPVSFADNYLYENYQRVAAFLKSRIKSDDFKAFAKPVLLNNRIDWFSDASGLMKPISEFNEAHQKEIEEKYVSLRRNIYRITSQLKNHPDQENTIWGKLIDAIFNTEDNLLVSNGTDWAVIWGWKFRNVLHFITPNFFEESAPQPEKNEPTVEISVPTQTIEISPDSTVQEDELTPNPKYVDPKTKVRLSFWERIKRFLRWLTYRFWGLLLLILAIMLICCICRKCSNRDDKCPNTIEKELDRLNQRIKDRCYNHKLEE